MNPGVWCLVSGAWCLVAVVWPEALHSTMPMNQPAFGGWCKWQHKWFWSTQSGFESWPPSHPSEVTRS